MEIAHQNFIRENRLKKSMLDMSKEIGISYNRVREFMIENNLQLTSEQISLIKQLKRYPNQTPKRNRSKKKGKQNPIPKAERAWDWDALP